jgi:carbamoylphosphate synthase small subunit
MKKAILALADGMVFEGYSFGRARLPVSRSYGMTGYQAT